MKPNRIRAWTNYVSITFNNGNNRVSVFKKDGGYDIKFYKRILTDEDKSPSTGEEFLRNKFKETTIALSDNGMNALICAVSILKTRTTA